MISSPRGDTDVGSAAATSQLLMCFPRNPTSSCVLPLTALCSPLDVSLRFRTLLLPLHTWTYRSRRSGARHCGRTMLPPQRPEEHIWITGTTHRVAVYMPCSWSSRWECTEPERLNLSLGSSILSKWSVNTRVLWVLFS